MDTAMLRINIKSKKNGGSGTIIINITAIINTDIELFNILFILLIPFP